MSRDTLFKTFDRFPGLRGAVIGTVNKISIEIDEANFPPESLLVMGRTIDGVYLAFNTDHRGWNLFWNQTNRTWQRVVDMLGRPVYPINDWSDA